MARPGLELGTPRFSGAGRNRSNCSESPATRRLSSSLPAFTTLGLGVLLIGIAGKLAYGEATGEKVATLTHLGAIVAVLIVAIGASLLNEGRAPTSKPLHGVN